MDDEEEDRILLSTLGVTSANVEDVERRILEKTEKDAGDSGEASGSAMEEGLVGRRNEVPSSRHENLVNKLRAVEVEIEAVASSIEHLGNFKRDENDNETEKRNVSVEINGFHSSANDLSLQQALASDRLESLIRTRSKLEKEILDSSASSQHDELIRDIVKSEPVLSKRTFQKVEKPNKSRNKKLKKISVGEDDDFDNILNAASTGFVETERDALVRKGILTPFHKLKGYERLIQQPESSQKTVGSEVTEAESDLTRSIGRTARLMAEASKARPTTMLLDPDSAPKLDAPTLPFQRLRKPLKISQSFQMDSEKGSKTKKRRPQPGKKWKKLLCDEEKIMEEDFREPSTSEDTGLEDAEELAYEGPDFVTLEGGLKIPESIFSKLFDYQKVGVQWMWELHCQKAGGIIGDEMGLGKTIQVLAFLASLHFSGMYQPSIIICPVTLLRQWKREAMKWYPGFHAELLHDSAEVSHRKKQSRDSEEDSYTDSDDDSDFQIDSEKKPSPKSAKKWDSLINRILRSESGLLITTYEQLRLHGDKLLNIEWGYAVLDEGHRIRNPNAEITLVCKQLQTVHRIIMTGAPIQNKLSELWSLFDFVFPGKLGVLPVFEAEFSVPISVGGYANATPLQVSTAYRCAVVLRDLVMPYLLHRRKVDVEVQLPKKTEHVLFCSLTPEQRSIYRAFLASSEVEQIINGSRNSLSGIDVMRKICNHPDLLEREHCHGNPDYGNVARSGKMKVVAKVLNMWKEQGHRVLLFSQTQQMLDIIEQFLNSAGYNYRRMDGLTPVKQRMALIDEFNNSEEVFVFILTTKVGGLGTNLIGANRVIIFDPDWNPSTDIQARERAWRIGQKKDVTIYRLVTRGTIEEKVYQRQIFKHFLTNKILNNPQQRRFFKARELKDLFTLNDDGDGCSTETSSIFSQLSEELNVLGTSKDEQNRSKLSQAVTPVTDSSAVDTGSELPIESTSGQNDRKTDEESSFLQGLFEAHGIHSAMNHDAIMDAHDGDKLKLEEEAAKVAQRAAEALRHSRILRSHESIAVPTWTGKSGTAGAPSSMKRKFGSTVNSQLASTSKASDEQSNGTWRTNGISAGLSSGRALSSAELLARLKQTQEQASSEGLEQQFAAASSSNSRGRVSKSSSSSSGLPPELMIRQICTFIQQKGGSSSSSTIVDHFKDRVPSKDLPLFKNLLKEIATLDKRPGGSHWVLKPEYQDK